LGVLLVRQMLRGGLPIGVEAGPAGWIYLPVGVPMLRPKKTAQARCRVKKWVIQAVSAS